MRMTVIVFLILSSLVVKAQKQLSKDEYDAVTEKYRVEYQDADKLKRRLLGLFVSIEGTDQAGIEQLKQRFGISEVLMRSVALQIYTESLAAVKEKRTDGIDGGLDAYRQQVGGSLFCLGLSADQSTKQLLMSIALDDKEEMSFRQQSISSYLLASDTEEAKTALLRFLVEEDRMNHMERLSVYAYARTAYDASSPEKKAAILAALIAAANKEEGKIEFMKVDKILAERSAAYRHSRERLAMLERHSLEPPTNNLYTDRDLKAGLEECRKYKAHTSISTNLATLKARNFNLPQPDLATNNVIAAVDDNAVANKKTDSGTRQRICTYAFIGLTAFLLLGFGAWKMTRR